MGNPPSDINANQGGGLPNERHKTSHSDVGKSIGKAADRSKMLDPTSAADEGGKQDKGRVVANEGEGGSLPNWFIEAMDGTGTTSNVSSEATETSDSKAISSAIKKGSTTAVKIGSHDPEKKQPQLPSTLDTSLSSRSKGGGPPPVVSEKKMNLTSRTRSTLTSVFSPKKLNESNRHMGIDDEEGKDDFFALLLVRSLGDATYMFLGSITFVLTWSILCAYGSERLREQAESNPGGASERWIEDIEGGRSALSVVGSLFVFTVVFRFNACYDRWWESRIFWGDIISKSLELGMMNRSWIADKDLANRMSRYIILFSYASKALLRGKSLNEEGEDGPALVKRGLMTQEELDDMHNNPCWQPHYCLHMIRAILVEAHKVEGGKGLTFDGNNKVHGQLFRCWDNTLKDLNLLIGNCVRVRASGLPASYDAIVMMSYFAFFILASVVYGVGVGWLAPIIIFVAAVVIMFLIVMGSNLVDPFGYDKVDIPLEAFCETVELQIYAIDQRSRSGTISQFSRHSTPERQEWMCGNRNIGSSMHLISSKL